MTAESSGRGSSELRDKLRINQACERFEAALKTGELPQIDEYLKGWQEPLRGELLAELLPLEQEYRQGKDQRRQDDQPGQRDPPLPTEGHGLHIRCPHCHQPIELVDDDPAGDVTCSSCGSRFNLVDDAGLTYTSPTLANIAHFETIEQIGIGAFGTVWKARDTQLDRTVAIKIPRKGQLTPEETSQFLREARAAAQLRHPNIVTVHEVGRQDDTVYIVSDYVRGISLADWLSGQRPTSREAAELCMKIAAALHHAHESGVIHRDLKPANIMIDADGEPHIMDFGLAKREAGEVTVTVDGAMLGTPAYMSPEQARGEGHEADRRTDVYSLGVMLFELLSGELPFRGNRNMLIFQVLHEPAPSPRKLDSHIPRDLETICLKCLEKQPDQRYATAQILADELGRFLQSKPIHARPISRPARLWRWSRRNPVLATLSAVSLLLLMTLAIGGPLMAWRQSQLRELANQNLADYKVEKDRADDEAEKVIAERENAREEVKEHQQTLRAYLDTVSEAEVLKDPRFTSLKRKLLQDALAHYERFLARHRDDPQWAPDVANALFDIARLRRETLGNSKEDALTAYKKALAAYERLVPEDRDVTEYQRALAEIYNDIGLLYSETGKAAEALAAYRKALEIRERLARENPNVTQYQSDLSESHNNIGLLYRLTGKLHEALAAYQKALKIYDRLARENPNVTQHQSDLSEIQNNIAALNRLTGWPVEAMVADASNPPVPLKGEKRPAKPPIPTAAAQEAAEAKVRDIFDLDAAIGLAARAKLAREILATAKDTADEPASQYVMLRMVRDMSAFHGDYAAAERAIGEMHQRFEVDVIAMRSEALVQALAAKKVPTGHRKRIVREALRVVRECHEADRYEEAKKNIAAALKSATSLRSRDLLVNIRRLRDDGEVLAKQYEAVRGAFETLKTKPDDPAANASAGKYVCYVKADWKRGLAMLIKGNDAVLKELATREQRGVNKQDEQLVLADAWWDIAEQQPSHRSSALRKHAAGWYRKVLPKLTGLKKARVSKRLDAVLEAERKSVSLSSIDRIVLWNQHNSDSHNTGTLECNVILFRDGKPVWSVKGVRVPWERNLAKSISLKVPRVKADRFRVEVTRIYRDAGGFAEVQIFSGKENIALGAPVTASAPYGIDDPRSCDKITDGILSSAKHRVGYWLTKLGDPTGWAEIDLSK